MTDEQEGDYAVPYGAQQVTQGTGMLIKSPYPQQPSTVAANPFEYNASPASMPAQGFSGANGMPGQFPGQMPYQPQGQPPELVSTQGMTSVRPHANGAPTSATYLAKQKKHPLIITFSVLCMIAILAALGLSMSHFLQGTPSVTLYRASMQTVSQDIGGGGITYPAQRLDISYPFTAIVLSVFVKPGDKVTLNQPLLRIDLSQVNAQNNSQLQPHPGDDAPALPNGNLVANISGTVTAVNVYPGQLFSANKIMLTIFDESSVVVRVKVPLINYNQVHINQPVKVTPSALSGASFNGMVMSIIQNVDTQTDSFEIWVKVNNTSGNLLPGMSAFVQLQENLHAVVVPRLAVLNPDRDSIVFVERQQHIYVQHVQIVGYSGDSLLIGSGLAPNDLIVLVGLDSLQNGQTVHVAGIENQAN